MTCIVGYVDSGKVYIGADSCGTKCDVNTIRKDKKVFKNGEFLIGFTTSFRMGQLLRYKFKPPKIKKDEDIVKYMCTDFIDSIQKLFKDNNYGEIINGEQTGGEFLIGVRGRLFYIDPDFQVGESTKKFHSCGCGWEFALSAMYILEKTSISPENKIKLSLKSSEYFSGHVRRPFHILDIGE